MFCESNHLETLLAFVRSIVKSTDPAEILSQNKRATFLLDSLLKQVTNRLDSQRRLIIDQRFENVLLALAYCAVELPPDHQIRIRTTEVLLDLYRRVPTAAYYEMPSFRYPHHLPPAEVFSFSLHTALTELAASSTEHLKIREKIVTLIGQVIRELVEGLCKAAAEYSKERYASIYHYEVPFLFGALRSIGRISPTQQSLISQLFPMDFATPTLSIDLEEKPWKKHRVVPDEQDSSAEKNPERASNRSLPNELSASRMFFSTSASTYRSSSTMSSDRSRLCVTVPVLEHLHETLKLFDHRVVRYLDQIALVEHANVNRLNPTQSFFPYTYFGELLILCIIKLFNDNLEMLHNAQEYPEKKDLEHLSSITKSIYLFVQQMITIKLLDLDPDEYERNSHRYRTRVEANAAALELLCLSCNDTTEAEKLCAKCAEKFNQETITTKLIFAQTPLLVTSLEVLTRLAEKYKFLTAYTIRALCDFLIEPAPILGKIYRQANQHLEERRTRNAREQRAFEIFQKLRDTAINGLCKSMCIRLKTDPTCVEVLLVQFSAKLVFEKEKEASLVSYNTIITLSCLAMALKDEQNARQIISARFQQCLADAPPAIERLIIDQLGRLLMSSLSQNAYDEIMRLFTELIFDSVNTSDDLITRQTSGRSMRSQAVINTLANVAANIESSDELMNFLTNILEIFAQLGLKAKNTDDKTIKEPSKVKANISGLLHLLLVIANVVDRMPVITDPSERVFLLFQRFWFYCVLYGFADAKGTKYPKMYVDSLRFIAMKSPILVVGHVSSITLKAAMPLRAEHLTKQDHHELKSQLDTIFSSYSTAKGYIERFNVEQSVYTLSVYYLETFRVRYSLVPSAFQCIFSYLEDPGIIKDKYKLWMLIAGVGRTCFSIYVEEMKRMSRCPERNRNLEAQCQFLMVKRTHVRSEVQDEAQHYLHSLLLTNGFPYLFCSTTIIETLMNIINILAYSLDDDDMHKVIAHHRVPNTKYTIQFADTHAKRLELFNVFVEFGQTFTEQALMISPILLKSCIQQFMLKLEQGQRTPNAARQHKGLHIMWEYFTKYSTSSDSHTSPPGNKLLYRADFADYIASLSERSAAMGFVDGLVRQNYRLALNGVKERLEEAIRNRVNSVDRYHLMHERRRRMSIVAPINTKGLALDFEERIAIYDRDFRNELFKLTAMLIRNSNQGREYENEMSFPLIADTPRTPKENPLDREMIHALTWMPVKMFTTSVMEAAVDCWSWAIVGRPELESLIVEEIYKVWEKVISDRQGLYSIDKPDSSPLAPTEKKDVHHKSSTINPHRIFFRFIEERVHLSRHKDDMEMEMLLNLFHKSLSLLSDNSHTPMTKHVSAVGLRFRFVYLALYLVQSEYSISVVSRQLLRDKIYHTSFDYFTIRHHCPTQTSNELRNDIRELIQFFSLVHGEKRFAQDPSTPTIDAESSILDLFKTENPLTEDSSVHSGSKNGNGKKTVGALISNNPLTTRLSADDRKSAISSKRTDKIIDPRTLWEDLLKKRNLLLILLAYEIKRLETFHNPLGRSELLFDEDVQSVYKNWTLYDLAGISNKLWRQYAQLAWYISPDLAIGLFHTVTKDSLRKEIQLLVKTYPLQVRHIPEALNMFTTVGADRERCCETAHILTWAPINPVAALSYFASARLNQIANIYTIQYASRILYTAKPETLILYIPQIVQAVRYDEMGFVRRLILDLSKKSNLVAHQLIWNIRTNMFKNETTIDEDMKKKLEPIAQQIEIDFTPDAQKFYQRVFAFSDQLTKVSDTIKVFPKGNERKEACLKALKEIGSEVPPGVYLPSNPEAIVISIRAGSGAPMQSAAKAPYRATFGVQTVGIDQVERCADPDYEFMQDFSHQYYQMAIFKVGDDVRQDILALQIMRLFQNIFEQEGLELYLYAYRVIATSPGCGVIECVPNSQSREDIGRNTVAGLFEYYRHLYGKEDSTKFQMARRNFVMSMAAYSIALFMLQIKDRHNGNIMIDDEGHIVHIDFGFMFESSPGGNMGFEPDIKLTAEMILIMGDLNSPAFLWFKELCIKGYLALRPYRQHFLTLVALMLDTGLPCFRGRTLEQFNARFKPDANEADAARYMHEMINRCAHNIRTRLYDYIQFQQNSIPF